MVRQLRIRLPVQETGSAPGRGTKIPHDPGQPSLSTAAAEAAHARACMPQLGRPVCHNRDYDCHSEDLTQSNK